MPSSPPVNANQQKGSMSEIRENHFQKQQLPRKLTLEQKPLI